MALDSRGSYSDGGVRMKGQVARAGSEAVSKVPGAALFWGLLVACAALAGAVAACSGEASESGSGGAAGASSTDTGETCSQTVPQAVFECAPVDAGPGCHWPPESDAGPLYPEGCELRYFGKKWNGSCWPHLAAPELMCGYAEWDDACICHCPCTCEQGADGNSWFCPI
jgi:hypothetical protein